MKDATASRMVGTSAEGPHHCPRHPPVGSASHRTPPDSLAMAAARVVTPGEPTMEATAISI